MALRKASWGLAVAVAVCALLPSACSPRQRHAEGSPTKVRALLLPFLSFAPLIIAQEEGYFEQEGLEVEFVTMDRSAHALGALANGQLDVVAGSLNAGLLNAIARGADLRIVADKGRISRGPAFTSALVVRRAYLAEGRGTPDAESLRAARLAASVDNLEGYFLDAVYRRCGLTLDDARAEDVPGPAVGEALARGRLDMAWLTEPWLARVLPEGHSEIWLRDFDIMPDFQYAVLIYGPSFLRERPEAGARFMSAYLRGVRQFAQGKTERNVEIMSRHTRLDPDLVRRAAWIAVRPDGQINQDSVLAFQAWAFARGLLDRELKLEEMWEPRFLVSTRP